MYKATCAILTLLAVVHSASAQPAAESWFNKGFSGSLTHNFGVVPKGEKVKHTFVWNNIWKAPLEIQEVRVSCGCVTAIATPKVVQPGQPGVIDVTMDTARFRPDEANKSVLIFVTVGPKFVSTATLTVSAIVRDDIVFNPAPKIDFGKITLGQPPLAKSIDVSNTKNPNWQVTEIIKNKDTPFELAVENLPPGFRGYRITATMKPNARTGDFNEDIVLKTNDPAARVLTFPIIGKVAAAEAIAGDPTVQPSPVKLVGVKVGVQFTTPVVVTAPRPFTIKSVQGNQASVNLTPPPGDAKNIVQILNLRVIADAPGPFRKELQVITDLSPNPVTVMIEGNIDPAN